MALISSGASPEESAFLDASESGGDVYFLSSAKLTSDDVNGGLVLFDAHECTAESQCVSPAAPASGGPAKPKPPAKRAPTPQPEVFGAGPSDTFSGPGNLTPSRQRNLHGSTPPCSSSLGAPSKKCTKKQNLKKALATCKRKYPKNKKKRTILRSHRPPALRPQGEKEEEVIPSVCRSPRQLVAAGPNHPKP